MPVAVIGVLLLCVAAQLSAHVTLIPRQSRREVVERYMVRVPTEGKVTTMSVELEVPAGVEVVEVPHGDGYQVEAIRESGHVVRIIWTKEIPPGERAEFPLVVRNPNASSMSWRAHQRFADGSVTSWIGPAGDRRPAAVVQLSP